MATTTSSQHLINSIIYLASLASDARAIDLLLDRLRDITAQRNTQQLTETDIRYLLELQEQLKDYLIHKDSVRRFNEAVLEQRLYEHTIGQNRYAGLRKLLIIILLSAFLVGAVVALLPIPLVRQQPQLPATAGLAILYSGAVILFLQAVKGFEALLKRAYVYLCIGVAIIAVLNLHFTFTKALQGTWWMESWAFGSFFAIAAYLLYYGMRVFAGRFDSRSLLLKYKTLIALTVVAGMLSIFIPHATTSLPEVVFRLSTLAMGLCVSFALLAGLIGWRTLRYLAPLYLPAIRILTGAISCFGLGSSIFFIIRFIWIQHDSPRVPALLITSAVILLSSSGLLFLVAGYVFNKASRR